MSHLKSRVTVVVIMLVAASLFGVVASRKAVAGQTAPQPILSNLPTPLQVGVPLTAMDTATLAGAHQADSAISPTSVDRLRVGASVDLYRVDGADGPPCFATGPRIPTDHVIGFLACAPGFPSASRPVLDFTVFHGMPGQPDLRVWQSSGFAADNVSRVAFETADGAIAASADVSDDLFEFTALPQIPVTKLVALDAAGNVIWSRPV